MEIKSVVEIPKGSRNKYEYDPEINAIKLDRFISSSVVYPTDYGYIPDTLSEDGDPLDVLVCVSEPTFPGCVVFVEPVCLLQMEDEHGPDPHVLCVPCQDPGWNTLRRLDDVPAQLRNEIQHFFAVYKDLDPDRHSSVKGWADRDEAVAEIERSRERFSAKSGAGVS